jgi:hypothetical protein
MVRQLDSHRLYADLLRDIVARSTTKAAAGPTRQLLVQQMMTRFWDKDMQVRGESWVPFFVRNQRREADDEMWTFRASLEPVG